MWNGNVYFPDRFPKSAHSYLFVRCPRSTSSLSFSSKIGRNHSKDKRRPRCAFRGHPIDTGLRLDVTEAADSGAQLWQSRLVHSTESTWSFLGHEQDKEDYSRHRRIDWISTRFWPSSRIGENCDWTLLFRKHFDLDTRRPIPPSPFPFFFLLLSRFPSFSFLNQQDAQESW